MVVEYRSAAVSGDEFLGFAPEVVLLLAQVFHAPSEIPQMVFIDIGVAAAYRCYNIP